MIPLLDCLKSLRIIFFFLSERLHRFSPKSGTFDTHILVYSIKEKNILCICKYRVSYTILIISIDVTELIV